MIYYWLSFALVQTQNLEPVQFLYTILGNVLNHNVHVLQETQGKRSMSWN